MAKSNDPMFDIEDSERVRLKENETASSQMLRARRVVDLAAVSNRALGTSDPKRDGSWFRDHIVVACVGGLLVVLIVGLAVWKWPELRALLK